MVTRYGNCLIVIIPANRCAAFNAWVRANIDPTGADWFTPTLSASGAPPATHAWSSFAQTDDEIEKWWARLTAISGHQKPANWATLGRADKIAWAKSNRAALVANAIITDLEPMENAGEWVNPQDVLTRAGLQVVAPNAVAVKVLDAPQLITPQSFAQRAVSQVKTIDWQYVLTRAALGGAIVVGIANVVELFLR